MCLSDVIQCHVWTYGNWIWFHQPARSVTVTISHPPARSETVTIFLPWELPKFHFMNCPSVSPRMVWCHDIKGIYIHTIQYQKWVFLMVFWKSLHLNPSCNQNIMLGLFIPRCAFLGINSDNMTIGKHSANENVSGCTAAKFYS